MGLKPEIWGPHYWFFLQTIGHCYALTPNDTLKKKYYDFFQNLPLFIPNKNISNKFIYLLDKYPITPYLDSRTSLLKWIHFIHNKVNHDLGKPLLTFDESMEKYYAMYETERENEKITFNEYRKYYMFAGFVLLIILIGYINIA